MEQIHAFIDKLEDSQNAETKTRVIFPVEDILNLCTLAQQTLEKDQITMNLKPPITIYGNIQGHLYESMKYLQSSTNFETKSFLFLGGYVNEGSNSLELIIYLFALKVLYPTKIFLLRSNHETRENSKKLGFYDECIQQYGNENGETIWNAFNTAFFYLPLTAVIYDRIFCVSSGLSQELDDISKIQQLQRPLEIGDKGLAFDLLWTNPDPSIDGWGNEGKTYGSEVVEEFLNHHDYDLICRGYERVPFSSKFPFPPNEYVITLCSASNEEPNNNSTILEVDEEMICTLTII